MEQPQPQPSEQRSTAFSRREERLRREQEQRRRFKIFFVTSMVAAIGLVAVLAALLIGGVMSAAGDIEDNASVEEAGGQAGEPTEAEIRAKEAIDAGAAAGDPNIAYLPTPLVATRDGLKLHSPISANHITEIEFHQASFDTALPLTPLVTIVDADDAADQRGTKHLPPEQQPFGDEPLIAEAVSTWRLDSFGDEMTAMDVGALAGTDVYAPITGTVVKIKNYSLFGLIDDYELHFQSSDYPGLDIVMLHIDNLRVEVGDKVIGGATRIATVRNIGDVIDNNLANFTAPGDPGNHCHVQVNDATREDYAGLEDALNIFS